MSNPDRETALVNTINQANELYKSVFGREFSAEESAIASLGAGEMYYELQSQLESLQKENDNLKEINEKLKSTFRERMAQSQITAITKERDEYREALEWYAWNMLIEGKRAREVLAKKQG